MSKNQADAINDADRLPNADGTIDPDASHEAHSTAESDATKEAGSKTALDASKDADDPGTDPDAAMDPDAVTDAESPGDPLIGAKVEDDLYELHGMPEGLLESFNTFREENILTDFEVEIGDVTFKCHKIVLAAASPYYRALFHHQPQTHRSSKLNFPNTSTGAFADILEFMYTSKLTIIEENIFDVLELADFLQFRDLANRCAQILEQFIYSNNAIYIHNIAEAHLCQELAHAASTFIKSNFPAVIETPDFIDCSFENLIGFLTDKTTVIGCEENLIKSLCEWMDADIDERKCYMETLFEFVHCENLDQMQRTELRRLFPFVETFFDELEAAHSIDQAAKDSADGPQSIPTKRPSKKIVLIPEYVDRNAPLFTTVLMYDDVEEKWSQLTTIPQEKGMCHQRAAVVDNCIYVTGGEVNGIGSNRVLKYDVQADTWSNCAPMKRPRYNHAVTEAMGYLYAFGGDDTFSSHEEFKRGTLNTLERYNPITDEWDMLEPLILGENSDVDYKHQTLQNMDLVHLGDSLYVLGATATKKVRKRKRNSDELSYSRRSAGDYYHIPAYHIKTNCWNPEEIGLDDALTFLVFRRHVQKCFPYQGLLVMILKKNEHILLHNPVTQKSCAVLSKPRKYKHGGYLVKDDAMYVFGGFKKINHEYQPSDAVVRSTFENAPDAHWETLEPLPIPLSQCKAVIVVK